MLRAVDRVGGLVQSQHAQAPLPDRPPLLGTGIAAAFCLLEATSSLDWLENRSADWRTTASADENAPDRDILSPTSTIQVFREITAHPPGGRGRGGCGWNCWVIPTPAGSREPSSSMLSSAVRKRAPTPNPEPAIGRAGNVIPPFVFVSAEADTELASVAPQKAAVRVAGRARPRAPQKTAVGGERLMSVSQESMAGSGSTLGSADRDATDDSERTAGDRV